MKGGKALTFLFLGIAVLVAFGLFVDHRADLRAARAEAKNPPEGEFVDVDGVSIHAVVLGDTGPWVALIHGASGNARDFTFSFAHELARDHRVIVFDRPGLGYSDRTDPQYRGALARTAESPAEQARVLAKAAMKIGAEDPVVMGYSYGGSVAMAWALDHPAAAVVLLSGVALPWPGGLGWTYDVIGNPLGGILAPPLAGAFLTEDYLKSSVASVFKPAPVPPGYIEEGGVRLATRAETIRTNGKQVTTLRPHVVAQSEHYDRIDIPIEVVHGSADTIVPAEVHAIPLTDRLENAALTMIEGAGHMLHHTHAEEVIAAIRRAAKRAGLHGGADRLD